MLVNNAASKSGAGAGLLELARPIRITLGHPPVVFTTPGSRDLATKVLAHLGWEPGACKFKVFDNNEISTKVDQGVTNCDVFVICGRNDSEVEVNFSLMQLFFLIDCLRGESPHRITVVLPCLEYARQDRRLVAGEAIPPKLFLRCMKTAGANRFLTVDLHNQAEAAFSPAGAVLDELSADKYLADFIRCNVSGFDASKALVCATNGGGMKFTRRMANELSTGFMMADRFRPKAGGKGEIKIISDSNIEQIEVIIVVDDMVDTCGSLAEVCAAVHEAAPKAKIYGVATHGYFSGNAHMQVKKLVEQGYLEWLMVTNSIAQTGFLKRLDEHGLTDRLKVVDISRLLAGAIIRIHLGASVNLEKFRSLGSSAYDPILEEAALVPPYQYVMIAGGQPAGVGAAAESSNGIDEASRMQLKRRMRDWES